MNTMDLPLALVAPNDDPEATARAVRRVQRSRSSWRTLTPEQRQRQITQRRLRRQAARARETDTSSARLVLPMPESLKRAVRALCAPLPDTPGTRKLTQSLQHILAAIRLGYRVNASGQILSPRGAVLAVQPGGSVEVRMGPMQRAHISAIRFAAAYWFGAAVLHPDTRVIARNGSRFDLRKSNIELVTHAERLKRAWAEKRATHPDDKPCSYATVDRLTARAIRYAVQHKQVTIAEAHQRLVERGVPVSYRRVYKIARGLTYL